MTISLGGVALNENLYLEGVENHMGNSVNSVMTIGGLSITTTLARSGGRTLTLTTTNNSGALQGIFCQSDIDAIQEVEGSGLQVTLTYRDRGDFQVVITGLSFTQFKQNEPVSPAKRYTGSIQLIEV